MNWESPAQFLAMGGHAAYVWGSFGVALVALGLEVALVRRRAALARRHLAQQRAAAAPATGDGP